MHASRLAVHPSPASPGILGGAGAALCGFTVHLCPLNPHVNVEVVKCHQLGRREGGRARKTPTKGSYCLGRGGGGVGKGPRCVPLGPPQPPPPHSSGAG